MSEPAEQHRPKEQRRCLKSIVFSILHRTNDASKGGQKQDNSSGAGFERIIGSQCWKLKNHSATVDRKGKSLIEGVDYFYPDGEKSNQGGYGLLYTWEAAKRCAPKGWRLPSDRDWRKLERTLGMNPQELLKYGGRGHIAEQLCDKDGKWKGSQEPSVPGKKEGHYKNAVDFSALPAGKFDGVEHKEFGESAYFWSSRRMIRNFLKKETWQGDFPNSSYFEWRFKLLKIFRLKKDAVYRSLHYNAASIFRHIEKTDVAFSVRYVKRKCIFNKINP